MATKLARVAWKKVKSDMDFGSENDRWSKAHVVSPDDTAKTLCKQDIPDSGEEKIEEMGTESPRGECGLCTRAIGKLEEYE